MCPYIFASIDAVPLCSTDTEEYEECGTACPATCANPSPVACNDMCVQGCFCQEGLVRQVKDGPCVPLDTCLGRFLVPFSNIF